MKNMSGRDPEWYKHKTFVEPWKPIPFLLVIGAILLLAYWLFS